MTRELKHTQVAILPPVCPKCNVEMVKAGGALSGTHEVQNWRCPICHRRTIKGLRVRKLETKKPQGKPPASQVEVKWTSGKRGDK